MAVTPTRTPQNPTTSPYATGGGGTVLEHRFAATVLAALLVGDTIPGLGDEFAVDRVAFQASTESAVDDLLVTGKMSRNGAPEHRMLDDLCLAATYSAEARTVLRSVWPALMDRCLSAWPGSLQTYAPDMATAHGRVRLLASLLPLPRARMRDEEADARIEEAGQDWVEPAAIVGVIDRWLSLAHGVPSCVDAIVGFLAHRPVGDRVQFGLPWLEKIIGSGYDLIAGRTIRLVNWIGETLRSGQVPECAVHGLHRIIDGLAARGDSDALRLQQSIDDRI